MVSVRKTCPVTHKVLPTSAVVTAAAGMQPAIEAVGKVVVEGETESITVSVSVGGGELVREGEGGEAVAVISPNRSDEVDVAKIGGRVGLGNRVSVGDAIAVKEGVISGVDFDAATVVLVGA